MSKYAFGPFHLDVVERRLFRGNEEIRLRDKLFETLRVLVENSNRLVRKDELLRTIWPDAIVEENNVDHCVSSLRKVLRPDNFIETVPRHGYRFNAQVRTSTPSATVAIADARNFDDADILEELETRFFTTSDGTRIAYTIGGQGPILIRCTDWLNHLGFEWKNPFLRAWLQEVMKHNTLVRYDARGCGLSDWLVDDFSFERSVDDFEELADHVGADDFAICGGCRGAVIAANYVVRHPDRVSKLIFQGAFSNGWPPPSEDSTEQFEAMLTLMRLGWGRDNPAFRQLWTSLFMPDATPDQMLWMNELQRISTSPENAVRLTRELPRMRMIDLLPKISTPTLVIHSSHDGAVPVSEGRLIASRLPNATFVELESRAHLVAPGDPAFHVFAKAVGTFLDWAPSGVHRAMTISA